MAQASIIHQHTEEWGCSRGRWLQEVATRTAEKQRHPNLVSITLDQLYAETEEPCLTVCWTQKLLISTMELYCSTGALKSPLNIGLWYCIEPCIYPHTLGCLTLSLIRCSLNPF